MWSGRIYATEKDNAMHRFLTQIIASLFVIVLMTEFGHSVAPTPEAIQQFKAEGRWEEVMATLKAFRDSGGCHPVENTEFTSGRFNQKLAAGAQAVDTIFVPVILVDFPDFRYNTLSYPKPGGGAQTSPAIGTPQAFDSILFSRKGQPGGNPTGSMTDYYFENSYGKIVLTGVIYGWFTMPKNYSYYVGSNGGMGGGGKTLAQDAVITARDLGVDFTRYDNNADSSIDGIIVIHAGPGAETGAYGIWSHRSSFPTVYLPNGKYAQAYTMNPEEYGSSVHPIGVFCHEYGHILGLPDLYDRTDTLSQGLGAWSLMASGNYNGNSRVPAHFDAWCKKRLGFIAPTSHLITQGTNLFHTPIPQVESEPFVYWLTPFVGSSEYFLIENRQWYGFDSVLPGEGMCIYHVDESMPDNDNSARYKVALVQADGLNSLANGKYNGDYGDPFPGTSQNRNWHDLSIPNSRFNIGSQTQIAAWNISKSDSIMYADLDTRWSRPRVILSGPDSLLFTDAAPDGNGNGILEAGETITFSFGVRNYMRNVYTTTATLTCGEPNLTLLNNGVTINGLVSTDPSPKRPIVPIKFQIPPDWQTLNVGFTLGLVMDSISGGGDKTWNTTFTFMKPLGRTQIILVDDDKNVRNYETRYSNALIGFGLPFVIWNKGTQGSPLPVNLAPYKHVIWFTGNEANGGLLNLTDITTLKTFMDAGGNVCIASVKAPSQIWNADSSFLKKYFHSRIDGATPLDVTVAVYEGIPGNAVSDQLTVGIHSPPVTYVNSILTPINGGVPTFTFKDDANAGNYGNGGVIFAGSYRSVLLSFGPEFLVETSFPFTMKPLDTLVARVLNFFNGRTTTGVDDVDGEILPDGFTLLQNYPNPFNPSTTIAYTIPASNNGRPQRTTIIVYNLIGQEVGMLADRVEGPGVYQVSWDGSTSSGSAVASGTYFYRISHGDWSASKKMILLK